MNDSDNNTSSSFDSGSDEEILMRKEISYKGQLFVYEGPQDEQISNMIELMQNKINKQSQFICVTNLKQKIKNIETWFKKKCSYKRELCWGIQINFVFTFYDFLLCISFLICYLLYLIELLQLSSKSDVNSDYYKNYVSESLIYYGIIFTLYGMVAIHRTENVSQAIFVIFLVVPEFIVLVVWLQNGGLIEGESTDQEIFKYFYWILLPIFMYLHWYMVGQSFSFIKQNYGEVKAFFCGAIYCITIPYYIFCAIITYFMVIKNKDFSYELKQLLTIIIIPVCIVIVGSWVLIHFKIFSIPIDQIAKLIMQIKYDIVTGQRARIKVQKKQNKCIKFFKRNVGIITSFIFGITYIACEFFLIFKLYDIYSNQTDVKLENIIILLVEIIAVPLYVIVGMYIASSTREQPTTFLFVPIILIAVPILILYPLSTYLEEKGNYYKDVADLIFYGPPTSCFIWLLLSILGLKKRIPFLLTSTFSCLFLALPLGFLYPLSKYDGFGSTQQNSLKISAIVLVSVGLTIVFVFFLAYMYRLIVQALHRKKLRRPVFDLKSLIHWNWQNYGYIVNILCFLISFSSVVWILNYPGKDITDDEKGYLYATLILLPIIFILVNVVLRTGSLYFGDSELLDQDDDADDIDQMAIDQYDDEDEDDNRIEKIKKYRKYQYYIYLSGLIIPLIVFVPIILIISSEYLKTVFFVLMLGIPVCFILYYIFVKIKNSNLEFQYFFTPCITSICWFVCIIPFVIIVPLISSTLDNTVANYGNFMRIVIGSTIVLCMFGVTSITTFIHMILNKIELEKKTKFIVSRLQILLTQNSYRSDSISLARLYQKYLQTDSNEKLLRLLQLQKQPLTRILDESQDTTTQYRVITDKVYRKLNKKSKPKNKKKKQWLSLCLDIFCCRIGQDYVEEDSDEDDNSQQKNLGNLFKGDDVRNIMDDYFPKDFKDNILKNVYFQSDKLSLLENLEKNKNDQMLEAYLQNDKGEKKSREQVYSSKTKKFQQIDIILLKNDIQKEQYKYTNHGLQLAQSEQLRAEFFEDIWDYFSNKDDNFPRVLIYNDYLQFLRLAQIYDEVEDKQSFIPKKKLISYYDQYADTAWKYGIMVLSYQAYCDLIKKIAKDLYPQEKQIIQIKYFCIDMCYVNLLDNIHDFSLNYKPKTRNLFQKNQKQQLKISRSPFLSENFDIQVDDNNNSEVYDKYLNQQAQFDLNNKENSNDMLFQNKIHPQDQQQDSIKKSKNKKNKLSCGKRCLYGCCRCMRKIYCSYPQTAYKKLEQKAKNLYVKIFGQKQIIRGKKVQTKKGKQKATSWEFICREMIEKIIEAEEEYEIIKKQGFNIDLKFNLGNLIAILSKFNDMFTFAIIAFSNGIVWIPGWKAFTKADTQKYSVSDGTFISSFQVVYFVCFAMAITYAFLSKIAYPFAAKDILGQDKDGNKAGFPHPQFFLTKSLQFIGASQFMSIMTTFLDSFICVWEGDSPWYLYRDQNIVCLSNSHVLYMIGAVIGILCYYPVSTFMFPNFQFQDKALDIKYDPTFLVIYMQVKILILGVTSFFKSFGVDDSKNLYIYLQLGTTAFCMLLLSIIQVKNRPCIIGFINIFEIALYLIIATLHITGILILVTDNSYLSLFVAVPVILLIILVTYIIYKKFYKKQVKVKQNINLQDMPDIELTKKQQGGQGLDAVTSKKVATNLALFDENGKQLDPESQNDKSKKHLDMLQRSDKKKKQTQLQLSQSKKSQMNKSKKNKYSGMFQ